MKSILIIEDDEVMVRGLSDNFESRGFNVTIESNGAKAIDRTLEGEADVILLDIMLPEMNGYEICRITRDRGIETPIIMLTAKGQEEDIVRGLELGADDYVTKPFSIRELVARVEALMRRSSTAGDVVCFGDCELNLTAHTLCRDGEPVALTSKEYQLLCLFVQRSGRALTRGEILNHVWGSHVIVTARSVDRCVTTLRAKIEPEPRQPTHITTIRDIGYRFELSPA